MKILGLDQASSKSGYSIWINGRLVDSGVLDHHKNKDSESRFKEMYQDICSKINAEQPNIVVLEDTQLQTGNASTYKMLCQLQGTIIGMCYMSNIKFKIMSPSQWRKILGFSIGPKVTRSELKAQSVEYVKREFGIECTDEESDAICIGAACHKIKNDDIDIEI